MGSGSVVVTRYSRIGESVLSEDTELSPNFLSYNWQSTFSDLRNNSRKTISVTGQVGGYGDLF